MAVIEASQRTVASLVVQTRHFFQHLPVGVVLCLFGLLTFLVQGYRLSLTPDVFSDEAVYLLVGRNLARGLGLRLDQHIFLWHPPGYMLIESVYLRLMGLVNADALTTVLAIRRVNIFFSALTAVVIVQFGRKLHSLKAGLIAVTLFLMDPYVQRINRRNMLETLALLCVLLGFLLFFTRQPRLTLWQRFGTGVAFGAAVLVKEPMFLELLALLVFVLLFRHSQVRDILQVTAIACALYALYPAWMLGIGQGQAYLSYKQFGLGRILKSITGLTTSSTVTLPPATGEGFLPTLGNRLTQYGMSYILITCAAIFTILCIVHFWQRQEVRYLTSWSIFSFGFGLSLGKVSDQYFYYLIVPATLIVGYFLATLHEPASAQQRFRHSIIALPYAFYKPILAFFCLMLLYNSFVWFKTYALGTDNAYMTIIRYVQTTLPPGTIIEASDDVAVYFLSPTYVIRLDRDPEAIVHEQARYFILSYKDVVGGYDGMTEIVYKWVKEHRCPVLEQEDLSFGQIGLYEINATPNNTCQANQMHLPSTWRTSGERPFL